MVDIKILWPDADMVLRSTLAVTVIIDDAACAQPRIAGELRAALQEFDLAIAQTPFLGDRLECALVAPPSVLAGLELYKILSERTPGTAVSVKTTLSAQVDRRIPEASDRRQAREAVAVPENSHWLVLISGGVNDDASPWPQQLLAALKERSLTVIPVLVGSGHDDIFLSAFGPSRPALRLQAGAASHLFSWLAKELLRVVHSRPDRRTPLDVAGMAAWAQT